MLSSCTFIPFFSLPPPPVSPIHCQEGPCQTGPPSVSWQRQRLEASAASTVSLDFISGGRGLGRPHTHTDSLQTLERNFHGYGCSPPLSPCFPWRGHHWTFMEVSCQSRDVDVLRMSHGQKAWRGWGGHDLLKWGAHLGKPPEIGRLPGVLSQPVRVVEAGGSAWTVVWLLSCISGGVPWVLKTLWVPMFHKRHAWKN